MKIPGVYGRVSVVVDWIKHLTSDGLFCEKPSTTTRITTTRRTTTGFSGSYLKTINKNKTPCLYQGGESGLPSLCVTSRVALERSPATDSVRVGATIPRRHRIGFVELGNVESSLC